MRTIIALAMLSLASMAGCAELSPRDKVDLAAMGVALNALNNGKGTTDNSQVDECIAGGRSEADCRTSFQKLTRPQHEIVRDERNEKFAAEFDAHFGKTPKADVPDDE